MTHLPEGNVRSTGRDGCRGVLQWLYQDFMGITIILGALRGIRLASLKANAVLEMLHFSLLLFTAFIIFPCTARKEMMWLSCSRRRCSWGQCCSMMGFSCLCSRC